MGRKLILNEKFYLALKADAMYSGDYDNLSGNLSRFATYRGVVALGYKPDKYRKQRHILSKRGNYTIFGAVDLIRKIVY